MKQSQSSDRTIVLIGDTGEPSEVYETLQDKLTLENATRKPAVLRYERFGYGYSESTITPRHANNLTTELEAVLEQLKLISNEKKIVLVGHGYGCFIARLLRDRYPDHIVSTVLVSPVHEKMILEEKEWFRGHVVEKLSALTYTEVLTRHGVIEPLMKFAPKMTYLPFLTSCSPASVARLKAHLLKSTYYGTLYSELLASPISARQVVDSKSKSFTTSPVVVVDTDHSKDHLTDRAYFGLFAVPNQSGLTKQQYYMQDLLKLSPSARLVNITNHDHYSVLSSNELADVIREESTL
jgi:pimeloyl-ACP methyl ester carboxylesterase